MLTFVKQLLDIIVVGWGRILENGGFRNKFLPLQKSFLTQAAHETFF